MDSVGSIPTKRVLTGGLSAGLIFCGGLILGQTPDGPPDIDPPPVPNYTPEPLGAKVIPPFNVAEPGSTAVGVGQKLVLKVIFSLSEEANIQWVKDDDILSEQTGTSLLIDEVSELDAGNYKVYVTFNGTTYPSSEIGYQVLPMEEIDDIFDSWTSRFFTVDELQNPELSGKVADPDIDSLGNLAEYFFGLIPTKQNALPPMNVAGSENDSVSFSFTRAQERTDLDYTVEGSTSLTEWVPLTINQTTVTRIFDATETVEVDLDWPFEPAFPRFLRLVIEQADQ